MNTRTTTGAARDFFYTYATSGLLNGYTSGSFAITRDYEATRDLATRVEAKWGSTSLTRFDYAYTDLRQRRSSKQSGTAFADYTTGMGYSGTYRMHGYNGRGEVESTALYRGNTPPVTGSPAPADELPGRRHEYRFDNIGNRVTAGSTGSSATDDEYTSNALNQYTAKENNAVRVNGTATAAATVATEVAGSAGPAVSKVDRAYAASLMPSNASGPARGTVKIYAALVGAGAGGKDLIRPETRAWQVARQNQPLTYDLDGNLLSDGLWDYTYDAENRLVNLATTTAASAVGIHAQVLQFKYDYAGRRVQKRALNTSLGSDLTTRYLYEGWNLVAELDATGTNLLRTFSWGLDIAQSLGKTGGVGALVQVEDLAGSKSLFATHDGNGNVAALVNGATGTLEATYEYGPFGELLRAEGTYSRLNPFRFSGKFQDDESGLVYYGVRYYSPEMGRFVNRDPIEEQGGPNLYGFCGNDGVNRVDYLGYSALSKAFKFVKKYWKPIVAVVASIVTYGAVSAWATTYLAGSATSIGAAWSATTVSAISGTVGGAAAGFVGGATNTALNGGNFGQTVSSGLRGAAAGAVMGGIAGYYGKAWNQPLQRIGVTSAGGGVASEINGGSFRDGALIAGAQATLAWGWAKTRQFTDENARRASLSRPRYANDMLRTDSAGNLQTAGTLPTATGAEVGPQWLNRLFSPLGRAWEAISMERQGSGLNWFEKLGRDGPINQFVQAVSKVHDWMNSWGYDRMAGLYVSRGAFYDSVFSTYSWAAMPPAAVYTAVSVAPPPLFLPRSNANDRQ